MNYNETVAYLKRETMEMANISEFEKNLMSILEKNYDLKNTRIVNDTYIEATNDFGVVFKFILDFQWLNLVEIEEDSKTTRVMLPLNREENCSYIYKGFNQPYEELLKSHSQNLNVTTVTDNFKFLLEDLEMHFGFSYTKKSHNEVKLDNEYVSLTINPEHLIISLKETEKNKLFSVKKEFINIQLRKYLDENYEFNLESLGEVIKTLANITQSVTEYNDSVEDDLNTLTLLDVFNVLYSKKPNLKISAIKETLDAELKDFITEITLDIYDNSISKFNPKLVLSLFSKFDLEDAFEMKSTCKVTSKLFGNSKDISTLSTKEDLMNFF